MIDAQGRLTGVFTDGDLRRVLEKRLDINTTAIGDLVSGGAKNINVDTLAAEALRIMDENEITSLVVLDDNETTTGVIHLIDLLHAGIA